MSLLTSPCLRICVYSNFQPDLFFFVFFLTYYVGLSPGSKSVRSEIEVLNLKVLFHCFSLSYSSDTRQRRSCDIRYNYSVTICTTCHTLNVPWYWGEIPRDGWNSIARVCVHCNYLMRWCLNNSRPSHLPNLSLELELLSAFAQSNQALPTRIWCTVFLSEQLEFTTSSHEITQYLLHRPA